MAFWNPFQRDAAEASRFLFDVPIVRLTDFHGGIAKAILAGYDTSFVLRSGLALPCRHVHAGQFSEGLCAVENPVDLVDTPQWHYIDMRGERVAAIAPRSWGLAGDFHEGLALRSEPEETPQGLKECYGYIDRSGAIVIALQFNWAGDFRGGLAGVRQGRRWGFIDTQGRWVITLDEGFALGRAPFISAFHEGLAVMATVATQGDGVSAGLDSRWGYLDRSGRVVIKPIYQQARPFVEGLGCVAQGDDPAREGLRWGFVDAQGREIIAPQYESASSFSEGLAAVRHQGREGFIDASGERVIACQYKRVQPFAEGLAPVQGDDGLWGYIDRHARVRIPFQYAQAESFSEGLAAVKTQEGREPACWQYIDALGRVFIEVGVAQPPDLDD